MEHYDILLGFFKVANCSPNLKEIILKHFPSELVRTELVALACIGKVLTGPWMTRFYTSSAMEENHMSAVKRIQSLVATMRAISDPMELMQGQHDLFGKELAFNFDVFKNFSYDQGLLKTMLGSLLEASVVVLERQYARYFQLDITPELEKEAESARCHNMDAEEIMGMFSASQQRAPHATLCYLSCRMRAKKNRTVKYLDSMPGEEREEILKRAVPFGRRQRESRRRSVKDLRLEIIKRQAERRQEKDESARRALQRCLKKGGVDALFRQDGLQVTDKVMAEDIMQGRIVGRDICHTWCEDGGDKLYSGSIVGFKKRKEIYIVAYWGEDETFEDATEYDMKKIELVIDYVLGDMVVG